MTQHGKDDLTQMEHEFDVSGNGDIRHVSGDKIYPVLMLHRLLQRLAARSTGTAFHALDITSPNPSKRLTNELIELNPPFNIDDETAKFLKDGSLCQQKDGKTEYYRARVDIVISN